MAFCFYCSVNSQSKVEARRNGNMIWQSWVKYETGQMYGMLDGYMSNRRMDCRHSLQCTVLHRPHGRYCTALNSATWHFYAAYYLNDGYNPLDRFPETGVLELE